MNALDDCRLIDLPKIVDARGNLTFVQSEQALPFTMKRVYWVYDVPGGEDRAEGQGHAYRRTEEFVIALSGSFDVTVEDGRRTRRFTLNRSYFGLFIPNTLWRRFHNFSTNAVCLVMASTAYDSADYMRDRSTFVAWRAHG